MSTTVVMGQNWSIIHISRSPSYRLRLADGRCVYMAWHNYCGPTFYYDKMENREIKDWWEEGNELGFLIQQQLSWFINRGEVA